MTAHKASRARLLVTPPCKPARVTPAYTADIFLIYSAGPLFLLDAPKTVTRLKELAEERNAQQSFREIWFLAHYWTGDQKLYRVT